jgi:hypothetical protein
MVTAPAVFDEQRIHSPTQSFFYYPLTLLVAGKNAGITGNI